MKTYRLNDVIFHADDFGANKEISGHIIDCLQHRLLCSISILPNAPDLHSCMEMLEEYRGSEPKRRLLKSIHLNIAEGPALSPREEVMDLTDSRGMFHTSFFKLFLISLLPFLGGKRSRLFTQLKAEFQRQIERVLPYVEELRLDSHQHYHMIPLVWDAMLEAAMGLSEKSKKPISFIRVPAEPIGPFLKHPSLWKSYRPVNFIKNAVLNFLYMIDAGRIARAGAEHCLFFGIIMSGGMDGKRVKKLLPDFMDLAERRGQTLELLAHPGGVRDPGSLMDPGNSDCAAFYTSEGRRLEKDMLTKDLQA